MKPSYTNQHLVQRAGYFAVALDNGTWEYYKMTGNDDPLNPRLIRIIGYTGPCTDGVFMRKLGECYLVSPSNINRMVIPKISVRKLRDLMAAFNTTPTPADPVAGTETISLGSTAVENSALTSALDSLKAKYPELG